MSNNEDSFVIRIGGFYFAGWWEEKNDTLFSGSVVNAVKYTSLEELEKDIAKYNINGYSVGIDR